MARYYHVYLEDGFDYYAVSDVCDSIPGADIWPSEPFVRFVGSGEELEEFKRTLTHFGFKVSKVV